MELPLPYDVRLIVWDIFRLLIAEGRDLWRVHGNGGVIQYLDNPTETVKLAAVTAHWYAIRYIPNPSEAVQLALIGNWARAIRYLADPSEAVQLAAAQKNKSV